MKKKLLAIVLACLILGLAITAGTATRRCQALEFKMKYTSDMIANDISYRLSQIPFSYEELVELAQEKSYGASADKASWDISVVEQELDYFAQIYQNDETDVSGGKMAMYGIEHCYYCVREILEKKGPSEELEKLYKQLEPYCRLLFEWEIKEYPHYGQDYARVYADLYANADALAQRFTEIEEADFVIFGNEIRKGIDKLRDEAVS